MQILGSPVDKKKYKRFVKGSSMPFVDTVCTSFLAINITGLTFTPSKIEVCFNPRTTADWQFKHTFTPFENGLQTCVMDYNAYAEYYLYFGTYQNFKNNHTITKGGGKLYILMESNLSYVNDSVVDWIAYE